MEFNTLFYPHLVIEATLMLSKITSDSNGDFPLTGLPIIIPSVRTVQHDVQSYIISTTLA